MRFIIATASRGNWPEALSADSITASAPSNTAVATSETSARVGTGVVIIDSSICVATTTGLPSLRAMRMIVFCKPGTRSTGISTPRSPRATMMPSETAMISSSLRDRLRLLDLRHHIGALAGDRLDLGDVLGALHEGERHPVDVLVERGVQIGAVLVRHRRGRQHGVGQADALLVGDLAGDLDHALGMPGADRDCTRNNTLPSSISSRWPVRKRLQDFGMRQLHAMRIAGRGVVVER